MSLWNTLKCNGHKVVNRLWQRWGTICVWMLGSGDMPPPHNILKSSHSEMLFLAINIFIKVNKGFLEKNQSYLRVQQGNCLVWPHASHSPEMAPESYLWAFSSLKSAWKITPSSPQVRNSQGEPGSIQSWRLKILSLKGIIFANTLKSRRV